MAFLKTIDIKVEGNMWLGGLIKITAIFNDSPDSVTITIEDDSGTDKIDAVAMTQATGANRVYEYIYQSSESDNDGLYEIYIRGIKDSNTSFSVSKFILEDAEDD